MKRPMVTMTSKSLQQEQNSVEFVAVQFFVIVPFKAMMENPNSWTGFVATLQGAEQQRSSWVF